MNPVQSGMTDGYPPMSDGFAKNEETHKPAMRLITFG
jgi:hypothetical protein